MNTRKNHYNILGISQESSEEEIKRAYRKLAQIYHPDAQLKSADKFLEISTAYQTLVDKKMRLHYDKKLNPRIVKENRSLVNLKMQGYSFKNIFRKINLFYLRLLKEKCEFEISALESIRGSTRELIVQKGSRQYKLKVKIPSGTRNGQKLRIFYPNFPKPILIVLKIKPHPLVERSGDNIIFKIPITKEDAIYGVELQIPTPSGRLSVQLPRNWPTNKLLQVPGKGFMLKTGKMADIYIKPEIVKFSQSFLQQKRDLLSYC